MTLSMTVGSEENNKPTQHLGKGAVDEYLLKQALMKACLDFVESLWSISIENIVILTRPNMP